MKFGVRTFDDHDNLSREFREIAKDVAEMVCNEGSFVQPYNDENLTHFAELDAKEKEKVVSQIRLYRDICHMTLQTGFSLKDASSFVWQALKVFRLRAPADFFEHIEESVVVEIHTSEGIQIFRNLRFFDICSYTLEELYCLPWTVLFCHEELELHKLLSYAQKMFTGEIKTTFEFDVNPHILEETQSHCKFRCHIQHLHGAPLYSKDGVARAHIVTERVELLNPDAKNLRSDFSKSLIDQPVYRLGLKALKPPLDDEN